MAKAKTKQKAERRLSTPSATSGEDGRTETRQIPPYDLIPTKDNPRGSINQRSADFKRLVQSVKAVGVKVHVHARPHPDHPDKWDLRDGARRVAAAKLAKLPVVPVIVHLDMTDQEAAELTVLASAEREDLAPVEKGRAVEVLLRAYDGDVKAVASKLNISETQVRARAHLKDLSAEWKKALDGKGNNAAFAAQCTVSHLALVARFPQEVQSDILVRMRNQMLWHGIPSVKDLETWLNSEYQRLLSKAPFDTADPALCPVAGACSDCMKRSSCQGDLFHPEDLGEAALAKKDQCLDPKCWQGKLDAWLKARIAAVQQEHPKLRLVADHSLDWEEEQQAGRTFGTKPLEPGAYDVTKESNKAAEPALVVTGPHAGELQWIRRKKETGQRAQQGEPPSTGPTPLAERKAKLQKRRDVRLLGLVSEALDFAATPADPNSVMALAASFGVPGDTAGAAWEEYHRLIVLGGSEPLDSLWQHVLDPLRKALVYQPYLPIDRQVYHAEQVCEVAGLDTAALRAQAEAELPEPKSWSKLNADGTPKRKKPAKKKAATKKASKKKASSKRARKPKGKADAKSA